MNTNDNQESTTHPSVEPQALINALQQLNADDLKLIYNNVKERLRVAHLLSTDNLNVISVRLPHDTCLQIRRAALLRRSTVSEVVRDAVLDYCEEERIA